MDEVRLSFFIEISSGDFVTPDIVLSKDAGACQWSLAPQRFKPLQLSQHLE
jgi:hypothetical protein